MTKLRFLRPSYWRRRADILERRRINRLRRALLKYYEIVWVSRENIKERVSTILNCFPRPEDMVDLLKFLSVDLFKGAGR